MSIFDRPPDLDTPKVNLWTQSLPEGITPASASLTIDHDTEEPFETRVYALENEPAVDGWRFKILSKIRRSDGLIMGVVKLQNADKESVYETSAPDWRTRARYEADVVILVMGATQAIQGLFPNAILSEPTITDGKTMMRLMEEARA